MYTVENLVKDQPNFVLQYTRQVFVFFGGNAVRQLLTKSLMSNKKIQNQFQMTENFPE